VVSIAKRFAGRTGALFEMISDANLPLIEAVERFDFSRGYRFSTYATWAIRNGLIRSVAVERKRRERYPHGVDELFDAVPDHREELGEAPPLSRNPAAAIKALLARLNDRERVVLEGRYGLDGARQKSLRQIGSQIGVSKERARQIEIAAREKLRRIADGLALGPVPA
jgi:RNA polymerase primary sigma factor